MDIQEDFAKHKEMAKNLPLRLEDKLTLYGLEKQAIYGPVKRIRPGMWNKKDPKEWDAWKACEAMSKEEAEKAYCKKVDELAAAAAAAAAE